MTAGFEDGGSLRMLRLGSPDNPSDIPVLLNDIHPPWPAMCCRCYFDANPRRDRAFGVDVRLDLPKGARPFRRRTARAARRGCAGTAGEQQTGCARPPTTAQAIVRRLLPPCGFFPFFAGFHGQFPTASALFTKNPNIDAPKFRGRFIGRPRACPAWRKRIMPVWGTCGP